MECWYSLCWVNVPMRLLCWAGPWALYSKTHILVTITHVFSHCIMIIGTCYVSFGCQKWTWSNLSSLTFVFLSQIFPGLGDAFRNRVLIMRIYKNNVFINLGSKFESRNIHMMMNGERERERIYYTARKTKLLLTLNMHLKKHLKLLCPIYFIIMPVLGSSLLLWRTSGSGSSFSLFPGGFLKWSFSN